MLPEGSDAASDPSGGPSISRSQRAVRGGGRAYGFSFTVTPVCSKVCDLASTATDAAAAAAHRGLDVRQVVGKLVLLSEDDA